MTPVSPSTLDSPADVASETPPHPERHGMVLLAIATIGLMFLGLVAVLYYYSSWRVPPTPTARIMFVGEESHKDAMITVEGPTGPALRRRPELDRDTGKHLARFDLPAGRYLLRVEIAGQAREFGPVTVYRGQLAQIDLAKAMERPEPRRNR